MDHFWGACEFSWKCESCQYYSKFKMINFLECFPGRWRSSLDVFSRINVARLCFKVSGKSTKGVINRLRSCFFTLYWVSSGKRSEPCELGRMSGNQLWMRLTRQEWTSVVRLELEGETSIWLEDIRSSRTSVPRYYLFTQNSGTKVIESAKVLGR